MPYAEGIYLDINQVLRQQMYWAGVPTNQSLSAYIRFHFGWKTEGVVTNSIALLETNTRGPAATSQPALDLLRNAELRMSNVAAREGWRWRILYLRALFDAVAFNGTTVPANARILNASFAELDRIYWVERDCCSVLTCAGAHTINCSAPGAKPFRGNCTTPGMRPGLHTDDDTMATTDETATTTDDIVVKLL